jgi:hypothetical protein
VVHLSQDDQGTSGPLLKDALSQLLQQVDLLDVFHDTTSSRSRSGSSQSEWYQLPSICAATWPDGKHIVAIVKAAEVVFGG